MVALEIVRRDLLRYWRNPIRTALLFAVPLVMAGVFALAFGGGGGDQITINTMGEGFTWETQDRQRDIAAAKAAWEKAKMLIADDVHAIVLLDELNIVLLAARCRRVLWASIRLL